MRGIKAKRIRREVYGDFSIRHRRYFRLESGMVVCDDRRRCYQRAKRVSGVKADV